MHWVIGLLEYESYKNKREESESDSKMSQGERSVSCGEHE